MLKKLKNLILRNGEQGVSKTKVASIAFLLVQVAQLFGYDVGTGQVTEILEGVLAMVAVLGTYQKVERRTNNNAPADV